MFSFRVFLIVISFISITACTTQKALQETGKEIDNGNYGVATWYTLTLPIVMIYDVVTLGGTSDVNTGLSDLSSAASAISPNSDAANTLSSMATVDASSNTEVMQSVSTAMVSRSQSSNPVASGSNANCDNSTPDGFARCCKTLKGTMLPPSQDSDGTMGYGCKLEGGSRRGCTYRGGALIQCTVAD